MRIDVKFEMFIDRRVVADRIGKKKLRVLGRTGGFTRKAMKRSMRKARKPRVKWVEVAGENGERLLVYRSGAVRTGSGRFVSREKAAAARQQARKSRKKRFDSGGSAPGEPPRYRSKELRDKIFFGVDANEESLVVGPLRFGGTGNVPQLLNEGGRVKHTLPGGETAIANYLPRPYATDDSPAYVEGLTFFEQALADEPL